MRIIVKTKKEKFIKWLWALFHDHDFGSIIEDGKEYFIYPKLHVPDEIEQVADFDNIISTGQLYPYFFFSGERDLEFHDPFGMDVGFIEIRDLDDEKLELYFHCSSPKFEEIISWIMSKISKIWSIERQEKDTIDESCHQDEITKSDPLGLDTLENIHQEAKSETQNDAGVQNNNQLISTEGSEPTKNKPIPEKELEPWEKIPDHGWDRIAVKMLWEGAAHKDIAKKINRTTATVANRLSKLRKNKKYKGLVPKYEERMRNLGQKDYSEKK